MILTRVYGIADPTAVAEPGYVDGLRRSVSVALGFAFAVIEGGSDRPPSPVPAELLVQARLAARNGVSLDTVLRRYCSGNAFFSDGVPMKNKTLTLSWSGSEWATQSSPSPAEPFALPSLNAVSCSAANACTAVGYKQPLLSVEFVTMGGRYQ